MGLEGYVKLQYAKRKVLGIREVNRVGKIMEATYIIVYFG